ncbi:type I methionyl aminopeptidase [Pseudoxanthomonas sp. SGD-10]|uniref:type I methionyl aminopeptidase n=1 Tax=Pseudoxanthomonas sp. GW2 TaxID=1211114 RepID=UPI000314F0CD|nr:type I methionyl aminopeptidase [Pseudoxanthomonas sp. GW2]RRN79375.1 type I methionyl aminopeptidase [Pseudoxanthomonas sp. SGD-10]
MTIGSPADLEGLKVIGGIVARVREAMLAAAVPGMTTAELDAIGERMLADAGATPAPRAVYGFPGATCISVNEEAAHGVPGPRVLRAGDVLNVDVSAELGGYYADTGGTRVLPKASARDTRLCHASRTALAEALKVARAGQPLNLIGKAIEATARRFGFRVIENLGSHGVGRSLHEEPDHIPGYYDPTDARVLEEGMVITIEPFISTRTRVVEEAGDGWTLLGAPGNRSAQYEHTLVITRDAPIVLTLH